MEIPACHKERTRHEGSIRSKSCKGTLDSWSRTRATCWVKAGPGEQPRVLENLTYTFGSLPREAEIPRAWQRIRLRKENFQNALSREYLKHGTRKRLQHGKDWEVHPFYRGRNRSNSVHCIGSSARDRNQEGLGRKGG